MKKLPIVAACLAVAVAGSLLLTTRDAVSQDKPAEFKRTPSPAGAESYIISPLDGETVGQTFTVRFGLRGMGVAPAGVTVTNTGHHHLLIDTDPPAVNQPIPNDATHKHFGGGQTETVLTLPPGEHTLQLILGDYVHVPHDPPVISKKITITVK
ncbi:MAG: DUF4399 domain-containing protein [Phycisphaera sp.]|nr:DUF4399 domain-containing protein [Phycisphaera sp.]